MNDDRDRRYKIVGARHAVPQRDNPQRHHRRSIRLRGYDYSQAGAYFVTVCTHDRMCLFGEIMDRQMRLNAAGRVVEQCWNQIPEHFPHVELDEFVVMPNHVHGIIVIAETVGAIHESPLQSPRERRQMLLPKIIGRFKTNTAKRINEMRDTPGTSVWQRNYYEHIIRNVESLNGIRKYSMNNPLQWALDRENPDMSLQGQPHRVAPTGDEPWRI
jgi:REP element-mobilizing transposase RayT